MCCYVKELRSSGQFPFKIEHAFLRISVPLFKYLSTLLHGICYVGIYNKIILFLAKF